MNFGNVFGFFVGDLLLPMYVSELQIICCFDTSLYTAMISKMLRNRKKTHYFGFLYIANKQNQQKLDLSLRDFRSFLKARNTCVMT